MNQPGVMGLGILVVVGLTVALYWRAVMAGHERRLQQLHIRIHVNGIRGKSTATRLIAGVLREGGFVTVAKTTGSAARVIAPDGVEHPIPRRGAATINEQVDIVERWVTPGVEALVIECMAVNPIYQQYSQEQLVRSDITVITNVREDHQEQMGESLERIADSMSVTIPENGTLITAEDRPSLRERLQRNAAARNATVVVANPADVSDDDIRSFSYLQFKSNVAIGLEVAKLLGIPRMVAMRGMIKAVPDVGAVELRAYQIHGKEILWVPLFAINDRESLLLTLELLETYYPPDRTVIGILNNRWDRGRRAEAIVDIVAHDLRSYFDHVMTFGAYEEPVTDGLREAGYPIDRVTNLGESVNPTLEQILSTIASLVKGRHGVLIGMVNIHTHQAELLIDHFARERGVGHNEELELSRDPRRRPASVQRFGRASVHRRRVRPGAVSDA